MIRFPIKPIALVLCASLISSCSSFPDNYDELPDSNKIGNDFSDEWSAVPALSRVAGETGFHISKEYPVPVDVADKKIRYQFMSSAQLKDLVYALSAEGIMTAIDQDLAEERLKVPFFSGNLESLTKALIASHNVSIEYRHGMLLLKKNIRYTVTVPQNKDLVERLVSQMQGMGAEDVQGDVDTGVISYKATPSANEFVTQYIQRAARNAAMIKLQVAVVDVRLNRDMARGFDWNSFSLGTNTGDEKSGALFNTDLGQLDFIGSLSGSGASWVAKGRNFNLAGAVKALSNYGTARTDQDIVLSTLSGSSVKIHSGNNIPYVDNIGTTSNDRNSMQSVQTATVESGLTVNVLPYFDVDAGMVTTQIEVELSSLVAFRELNAGQGLGTITQPEMQQTTFANITRLSPGETAVLGGIAYDQVDENHNSLSGLEKIPAGSKSVKTNRHAMFIMIRPTVVTFDGRIDRNTSPFKNQVDSARLPLSKPNASPLGESQNQDKVKDSLVDSGVKEEARIPVNKPIDTKQKDKKNPVANETKKINSNVVQPSSIGDLKDTPLDNIKGTAQDKSEIELDTKAK